MKARPALSGLLSAALGFVGTCGWMSWVILHDTNSTAAIGFLFLPVTALRVSIPAYLFGYCTHVAVTALRAPRRLGKGLTAAAIALAILLPFLWWLGNGWLLTRVVGHVRTMDREAVARFLEASSFRDNKFALNAALERQDLDAASLHKIAQMPSPELHERMGSLFPVMGANTKGLAVMRLVALHPNVDAQTLALLANSPNEYVLGAVAKNPKTPAEILPRLFKKGGYLIDWGLSANPHCPPEILHELASRESEYTRASVAENKGTRVEDLERLAKDPVWNVRLKVLMNPHASPALKETLRNDPDERVQSQFR